MIDILARILGTLFLLLSAYVILVQWYAIIARLLTRPERRKSFSLVPFIGGAFGCVSIWCFPETRETGIYWVPFFLDPGCALLVGSVFLYPLVCLFRCGKSSTDQPSESARQNGGDAPNE